MKKSLALLCTMYLVCSAAQAQSQVLACTVKEASGDAVQRPVSELKAGSVISVPVAGMETNGATYEKNGVFGPDELGERTKIVINRETGDFEFSAYSGSFMVKGTSKTATGTCMAKKLKM